MDNLASCLIGGTYFDKDKVKMKGFKNSIGSKSIAVLGAGRSGIAAARALVRKGSKVLLSDRGKIKRDTLQGISIEEFGHTSRIFQSDMVVLSPSIIVHKPFIQRLLTVKIPVISELELGYRLTEGTYIALTGTNGKTTTTNLIYQMIPGSIKAGNVGTPLSEYAGKRGTFVLEISSFQLMTIDTFKPDIAMILNIEEDHLDWHKTFAEYKNAKKRIFENQRDSDILILNYDDPNVRSYQEQAKSRILFVSIEEKVKGAFFEKGRLYLNLDTTIPILNADEMQLKGLHNIYNALFASLAAYLYHGDIEIIRKILKTFKSLPHRIEYLGQINGIKFYNDSKGTNPHAVLWALKGFKKHVILILGGEDKGLSFVPLKNEIRKKVKFIIAIGETKERIKKEIGDTVPIYFAGNMDEVVDMALSMGSKGDTVLLSPGCSSFDMYKNYKERGDDFRRSFKKRAQGD